VRALSLSNQPTSASKLHFPLRLVALARVGGRVGSGSPRRVAGGGGRTDGGQRARDAGQDQDDRETRRTRCQHGGPPYESRVLPPAAPRTSSSEVGQSRTRSSPARCRPGRSGWPSWLRSMTAAASDAGSTASTRDRRADLVHELAPPVLRPAGRHDRDLPPARPSAGRSRRRGRRRAAERHQARSRRSTPGRPAPRPPRGLRSTSPTTPPSELLADERLVAAEQHQVGALHRRDPADVVGRIGRDEGERLELDAALLGAGAGGQRRGRRRLRSPRCDRSLSVGIRWRA
jgi:hypothetical protein